MYIVVAIRLLGDGMSDEQEENGPQLDGDAIGEDGARTGIRKRLGRLLSQRDFAEDTKEVLGGVLEMSDRARTEALRLVAREARTYLEELKLKESLMDLASSHSLEMKLSLHLKPLNHEAAAVAPPAPAPEVESDED